MHFDKQTLAVNKQTRAKPGFSKEVKDLRERISELNSCMSHWVIHGDKREEILEAKAKITAMTSRLREITVA